MFTHSETLSRSFKSHNVLENSQDTEILFSLILTLPAEDLLVTDSLTSA